MNQLTYADRELLLRTFDRLRVEWEGHDDKLLEDACQWAKNVAPSFGFELALIRDVTALSRYLVKYRQEYDLADIARGGLLYILQVGQCGSSKLGDFGLLDDAFIANYAVHEIRDRLGEQASYCPPRLTREEQERAETQFLDFFDKPLLRDEQLVDQARKTAEGLASLATCGLFRRLQQNIGFLVAVLESSDRTPEQQSFARAALSYVVCEEDAIDDRLGVAGYLDDNFIAQMAVDLIEPHREPWLELLDATVGVWPFLNSLVIDDGSGGRPISEYTIVNSALSCAELRARESPAATVLIVPSIGPTPFLIGFVATLGLIQDSGQQEITTDAFRPGQKVLVDNCAVAEFVGFEQIGGRQMFGLRQYQTQRRERVQSIRYWPITDLRRLVPAASGRATRGQLTFDLSRSDVPLPGLEYLFNTARTTRLNAVDRHVTVVVPAGLAREMADGLRLCGHRLRDVVPMGHITSDGNVHPWSSRFGRQRPLLLFASDLDVACALAEEHPRTNQLVVVDSTGRNAGKAASLRRLQRYAIPTLVILPESSTDDPEAAGDDHLSVWEWHHEDFSSLLWPQAPRCGTGPIARHERSLEFHSSSPAQTECIAFPLAEQTFEAVRTAGRLARERETDQLVELDEIIALAYGMMARLLRLAVPLTGDGKTSHQFKENIETIDRLQRTSLYLSDRELSAIANVIESLHELVASLALTNSKAHRVRELLLEQRGLSIICPDPRLCPELERCYSEFGTRVFATYNAGDDAELDGAIVPGWFRRDRMARLLVPPATTPLILVLYDIERKWHQTFRRERRKARDERSTRGGRGRLFPTVRGWSEPKLTTTEKSEADRDSSLQELEAIQHHVRKGYRQRICNAAAAGGTEAEVSARLVLFDGDMHAFLTDSHKANVVTHLLDGLESSPDEKAEVKQQTVKKLKPGDMLLFHRGSETDVIKTAADQILVSGTRDSSSLWKTTLREYVSREGLTGKQAWERLRDAGCPLQYQTIRLWLENDNIIAPQTYDRDVPIIAEVTEDATLSARMDEVLSAISEVRSAHLRASHQLAQQVLARAVSILKEEQHQSRVIELGSNVVVVRVLDIDDTCSSVRASWANRLLEGEQWHV